MSRNTKIILGVVAGMLVLCMCVAFAAVAAIAIAGNHYARTAPEASVRVQQVLADPIFREQAPLSYEMPSGWHQDLTLHIFGFEMIGLAGSDGHSHIFLMQLPPERSVEASIKEAFDEANTGGYTSYRYGMVLRQVGETTATVRGQQVTMKISEGTNRDGDTYRQWAGAASDANRQTVVVIEQPVKTWDQAMVDRFIASIQ